MKKVISLLLAVVMCLGLFVGCGEDSKTETKDYSSVQIQYCLPHTSQISLMDTKQTIVQKEGLVLSPNNEKDEYQFYTRQEGKNTIFNYTVDSTLYSFDKNEDVESVFYSIDSKTPQSDFNQLVDWLSGIYGNSSIIDKGKTGWELNAPNKATYKVTIEATKDGVNVFVTCFATAKQNEMLGNSSTSSAASSSNSPSKSEVPSGSPHEAEFGAGIYTVGIDFPAGVYTLTALSGRGNVHSTKGVNEIMGIDDNEMYIPTFNNASLKDGEQLKLSGTLRLKIESKNAKTNELIPRKNTATEPIELASGNYVAGTDFPEGTYDITVVTGKGNVFSSADLNETFSAKADDFYISEYKNSPFKMGTTLKISGLTIRLTPSK